jgi:nucleoside-diphosphate-sugar epimerase
MPHKHLLRANSSVAWRDMRLQNGHCRSSCRWVLHAGSDEELKLLSEGRGTAKERCDMKVLVLGATGGTGQQVVAQALEQSHAVTVLVRDSARLEGASAKIQVLTGDLTNETQQLSTAMAGQDVAISTLGVGKSLKSGGLIARSAPLILSTMASQGVRRLILVSAYGVGSTREDVPLSSTYSDAPASP